jgi:hypothetical protein
MVSSGCLPSNSTFSRAVCFFGSPRDILALIATFWPQTAGHRSDSLVRDLEARLLL